MTEERWAKIEGFPNYSISDFGNIRNDKTNNVLKIRYDRYGYPTITMRNDGSRKTYKKTIHRLVSNAFIEKIEGKNIVDHIDNNRNNNYYKNLRWVNHHENSMNTYKISKPCSSIYKGVIRFRGKYLTRIIIYGKQIYIGSFEKEEDAAKAYNDYIIKNDIKCAKLNIIADNTENAPLT